MHIVPDEKRSIIPGLYIVDGNSYAYRSYYAIKNLTTSKGKPVNAVFGFARLLFKIHKTVKPAYAAVAFDTKHKTFRHEALKEYKAERQPPPEDLIEQMKEIKEMLSVFGIKSLELPGYEADDILMLLSEKAKKAGIKTTILTGDKDMLQLVDDGRVRVESVNKDGYYYDAAKVKERYGVTPGQMIDYLALAGDASDNIPGVPGIGEKTASALLEKYHSLDGVLENAAKIEKEGLRNRLLDNKETALLSRKLATLVQPPLELEINDLVLRHPDTPKLIEFLKEREFMSMLREAKETFGGGSAFEGGLFEQEPEFETRERAEVTGAKELEAAEKELKGTVNILLSGGKLLLSSSEERFFSFEPSFKGLAGLLEGKRAVSFGYKDCWLELHRQGIVPPPLEYDCYIAAYLLNPDKANYGAPQIINAMLNIEPDEPSSVCFLGRLQAALSGEIEKRGLDKLLREVELPLIPVLGGMEAAGIKLDLPLLKKISEKLDVKLEELVKRIYLLAGEEFNINSPQQLSKILFEKLKLPVVKKTKTGASTDVEVLEELSAKSELPAALLDYRQISKLKNTYIDALPELADKKTHKVHTHYNQAGTGTGRLSSLNPNLQNIPIRSELGREIRKAFIPSEKGWRIVAADYSQIELRILAHFSEDKNLIRAFKEDADIHTRTAMEIFDMAEEMVTSDERRVAKTVNFGIIYGITPFGLSRQLKIPAGQAKKYIDSYFTKYPQVKQFMADAAEKARKLGYADTLLGRRRYIPDINSKNKTIAEGAARVAINMPVQGSASDIIKLAMLRVAERLAKEKFEGRMLLQVHDELVFECPASEEKQLIAAVKHEMENVVSLKVPLKVDIESGDNWGE